MFKRPNVVPQGLPRGEVTAPPNHSTLASGDAGGYLGYGGVFGVRGGRQKQERTLGGAMEDLGGAMRTLEKGQGAQKHLRVMEGNLGGLGAVRGEDRRGLLDRGGCGGPQA